MISHLRDHRRLIGASLALLALFGIVVAHFTDEDPVPPELLQYESYYKSLEREETELTAALSPQLRQPIPKAKNLHHHYLYSADMSVPTQPEEIARLARFVDENAELRRSWENYLHTANRPYAGLEIKVIDDTGATGISFHHYATLVEASAILNFARHEIANCIRELDTFDALALRFAPRNIGKPECAPTWNDSLHAMRDLRLKLASETTDSATAIALLTSAIHRPDDEEKSYLDRLRLTNRDIMFTHAGVGTASPGEPSPFPDFNLSDKNWPSALNTALIEHLSQTNIRPNASDRAIVEIASQESADCNRILKGDAPLFPRRNHATPEGYTRVFAYNGEGLHRILSYYEYDGSEEASFSIQSLRRDRLHAALLSHAIHHAGKLPESLYALGLPPLAYLDPVTAKPFGYDPQARTLCIQRDDESVPITNIPMPACIRTESQPHRAE